MPVMLIYSLFYSRKKGQGESFYLAQLQLVI